MGGRADGFDQEEQSKGTVMLRLSEVEFRAAMLRHEEIKREADRLGPIKYELRQQRVMQGHSLGERVRDLAAASVGAVSAFVASPLRIRSLVERLSVR
jgi:hypothetical protein